MELTMHQANPIKKYNLETAIIQQRGHYILKDCSPGSLVIVLTDDGKYYPFLLVEDCGYGEFRLSDTSLYDMTNIVGWRAATEQGRTYAETLKTEIDEIESKTDIDYDNVEITLTDEIDRYVNDLVEKAEQEVAKHNENERCKRETEAAQH
jgi:hypothetical protein